VVLAGTLVGSLAGCSADEDEPERELGPRATCVSADPQGELILVPGTLRAGSRPWELTSVELRGARNLEVVEASTVGFTGQASAKGIVLDYPPLKNAGIADSYADWDERLGLPGTVTAADGLQAMLVAVRLSEPTEAGRLTGVTLDYSEGGEAHTLDWTHQVLVEPPGEVCTVDDVAGTREWTG